jgi:hypothetical protein
MTSSVPIETNPITKRKATLWVIVIVAALFMAGLATMLVVLPVVRAKTGDQITRSGNVEDTREAVKILLDSYTSLINLVTAAFGAVAFLLTFQRTQEGIVARRAWNIFVAGVVFLALALFLGFVGREELLMMVTRDAVDITLPVLSITRWLCYATTVGAAIMISFFAAEVTFS